MVTDLERRFYRKVTRYSSSTFTRLRLGAVFARSKGAHIFHTAEEAEQSLKGDA